MRSQITMWAFVLTLITCGRALGGEPAYGEPPQPALPAAAAPGRWLEPVRRRPAALVEPSLFSLPRCPGRLLPQAASQGVLAALPALLHLWGAGDRLSPEQWFPGLQ